MTSSKLLIIISDFIALPYNLYKVFEAVPNVQTKYIYLSLTYHFGNVCSSK